MWFIEDESNYSREYGKCTQIWNYREQAWMARSYLDPNRRTAKTRVLSGSREPGRESFWQRTGNPRSVAPASQHQVLQMANRNLLGKPFRPAFERPRGCRRIQRVCPPGVWRRRPGWCTSSRFPCRHSCAWVDRRRVNSFYGWNPNFILLWMMLKLYEYDYRVVTVVISGWLDKTLIHLLNF